MFSRKITFFIHTLLGQGTQLFVDDGDLRAHVAEGSELSDGEIQFIKTHKDKIKQILQDNNITYPSCTKLILSSNTPTAVLSFAQERLWFLYKYDEANSAYNVPMLFKIKPLTNIEALKRSLESIVSRHEVLHSLIKETDGNGYQYVLDETKYKFNISLKSHATLPNFHKEIEKEVHRIYKLEQDLPMTASIHTYKAEDYLHVVVHHIAFDGWSVNVWLNELESYYSHFTTKEALKLQDLSI